MPADVLGFGYVYDEQGSLIGEYGAGGAKSAGSKQYLYLPTAAGPMPVSVVVNSDRAYSVVADHLNTPRRITAPDTTLVWQWGYSAFGDEAPTVAARKFASVTAVDGDLEFNLRYPGQYFDRESNLHYNGFRTYNPVTGRYTQGDPIGLQGGWNRFGYVGGNPLRFTDPSGLNPVAGAMAGASAGSAFGPVGTVVGGVVGAGVGAAIGWNVVGPMLQPKPMMSSGLPPGFWPADKGAEEWGRRNGVGRREGKGRFHGIKQGCNGRATDNFGVDPETGEVIDPEGESVGNLWDAKSK